MYFWFLNLQVAQDIKIFEIGIVYLSVKVKQSRYRPGVAQRVPGN